MKYAVLASRGIISTTKAIIKGTTDGNHSAKDDIQGSSSCAYVRIATIVGPAAQDSPCWARVARPTGFTGRLAESLSTPLPMTVNRYSVTSSTVTVTVAVPGPLVGLCRRARDSPAECQWQPEAGCGPGLGCQVLWGLGRSSPAPGRAGRRH
jgi:hypothetical protein